MGVSEGIQRESAVGGWSVTVPVAEGEQREAICNGYSFSGDKMRTATLRAWRDWSNLHWRLTGPNIRADGTPGARTLTRVTSRAELAADYPATLAAADVLLLELARVIRADAEQACAQVEAALAAGQ